MKIYRLNIVKYSLLMEFDIYKIGLGIHINLRNNILALQVPCLSLEFIKYRELEPTVFECKGEGNE